jgi:hypothetical protein
MRPDGAKSAPDPARRELVAEMAAGRKTGLRGRAVVEAASGLWRPEGG